MARAFRNSRYSLALSFGTRPCHIRTIIWSPSSVKKQNRHARACLFYASLHIKTTALPNARRRNPPASLRPLCPTRCRAVFGGRQQSFFKLLAFHACFGREKGVCDRLQRHPLIDPIFGPRPLLIGKRKSLARPSRDGTSTS